MNIGPGQEPTSAHPNPKNNPPTQYRVDPVLSGFQLLTLMSFRFFFYQLNSNDSSTNCSHE
jgi:hypothetical protein